MKLPTQASPVRRFVVQDYSAVQERIEEVANKTNSLELKLKPKKEHDSSSTIKDVKEILKEVSSGASITQQTPNTTHESPDDIQKYPIKDVNETLEEVSSGGGITQQTPNATHEPPDDIQKYPSDTGLWTKLEDKEATIQEDLNAIEIKYGRRLFKRLIKLFSLVLIALLV